MDVLTNQELNTADALALAADLFRAKRYGEAGNLYAAVSKACPGDFQTAHVAAVALLEADRPEEALPLLDHAGKVMRDEMLALSLNRGKALGDVGRASEAFAIFDSLIRSGYQNANAYFNRGLVHMQMRRYDEASADMDECLKREPAHGRALFAVGFINLVQGRYEKGFEYYERREKDEIEPIDRPEWTGVEDIFGKTIMVHADQGFGDNIMFSRFLPVLVGLGAKVYAVLDPSIAPLLRHIPGVTVLGRDRTTWPVFDYWVRFMSLAWCFRVTAETLPPPTSLIYDEGRTTHWKRRIKGRGLKVGLVWSGNRKSRYDKHRNVPLEALRPLFGIPRVQFYGLQLDVRDRDRPAFDALTSRDHGARSLIDLSAELTDFRETAHALRELDLMVTVDTSIAHLAGTVGIPTLVTLTDFRTYWLWIEKRETSPWYPSVRTLRQQVDGDWAPVVAAVRDRITALL